MDEVGVVGEHSIAKMGRIVASQGQGGSEADGVGAALHGIYAISPEPHLHLEVHAGDHPLGSGGPSLRFEFLRSDGGEPFSPVAGSYYTNAAAGLAPLGTEIVGDW